MYCAKNGRQALEKLNELPQINLIISDIMMGAMDGYEFLKTVSADKRFEHIPFIFLTAKSGEGEKIKGLKEGAIDFIAKPFHFDELLSRIRALLRNQELRRQNYEKDKFAALGMLIGGISHEILNPLSGVSAPLDNIKKIIKNSELKDHKNLQTCLEHIDNSVSRITGIVNNLKILYSDREYRKEKLDFKEIIAAVLDFLHKKIPPGIKVNVEIAKQIKVAADRDAVFFIFVNLISNAAEAIAGNGVIDISVAKKQGGIVIKIADTGCGIDDKDIRDIFNAFYSTKSITSNIGLGLYSAKAALEDNDVLEKPLALDDLQVVLDKALKKLNK